MALAMPGQASFQAAKKCANRVTNSDPACLVTSHQ